MPAMMPRLGAAIIAIVCWIGLGIQFSASYADHVDLISTLWSLGRFFTILTNLLVAVTMTWVAIGGKPSVNFLGGVTIAIILVGVVYVALLQGLRVLTGGHLIADTLLHKVSPILMALWWLFFAPRAKLRYSAALWCSRTARSQISLPVPRRRQDLVDPDRAQHRRDRRGLRTRRATADLDRQLASHWFRPFQPLERPRNDRHHHTRSAR